MNNNTITINRDFLTLLIKKHLILDCLMMDGVDETWDNYGKSFAEMKIELAGKLGLDTDASFYEIAKSIVDQKATEPIRNRLENEQKDYVIADWDLDYLIYQEQTLAALEETGIVKTKDYKKLKPWIKEACKNRGLKSASFWDLAEDIRKQEFKEL